MGFEESEIAPAAFLEDVEMRVGEIVDGGAFPEAHKDVYKLTVDFGDRTLRSAVVSRSGNCRPVSIAGFESECLVTGVDGDEGVGHLTTERDVPLGTRVY